jgi:hypothetical protein
MPTKTISHQTALDTHLLTHAKALIAYAATDEIFAESLAALVNHLPDTPGRYLDTHFDGSHFVAAHSQDHAIAIATWLLEELKLQPTRTRHTTALLQAWAEPYQAPKDQIIGIVGIAIMGPTLGLIKKNKKKKKSQLQVIINDTWKKERSTAELFALAQRVSQGVIAKELALAGGNAYRLHPDSAEWCLSDPKTKLHLDTSDELHLIEAVAQAEQLSHVAHTEHDRLIALALSPSVNENFIADFSLTELA